MNVLLAEPALRVGPKLSFCQVDAAGVPAEWVEAGVATEGQPTFVYFVSCGSGVDALEHNRASAGALAIATGARVLTVACSVVQRGIAAYTWLLGEGCNLELTAFAHEPGGASLVEAIMQAARERGLPVPSRSPVGGAA